MYMTVKDKGNMAHVRRRTLELDTEYNCCSAILTVCVRVSEEKEIEMERERERVEEGLVLDG
jgi:hypothetical protein